MYITYTYSKAFPIHFRSTVSRFSTYIAENYKYTELQRDDLQHFMHLTVEKFHVYICPPMLTFFLSYCDCFQYPIGCRKSQMHRTTLDWPRTPVSQTYVVYPRLTDAQFIKLSLSFYGQPLSRYCTCNNSPLTTMLNVENRTKVPKIQI